MLIFIDTYRDALKWSDCISSNGRTINVSWTLKDVEGGGRSLISGRGGQSVSVKNSPDRELKPEPPECEKGLLLISPLLPVS
jgi:hypothetical protein